MKSRRFIAILYGIAAAYDGIIGAAFFLFPGVLFTFFQVPPPNHFGYVRFPAALLVVFGLMFTAVACNPLKNRNLIPYGILLKASYCGVAFGYWFTQGIPNMWKPFAVLDLVFALLFYITYKQLGQKTE